MKKIFFPQFEIKYSDNLSSFDSEQIFVRSKAKYGSSILNILEKNNVSSYSCALAAEGDLPAAETMLAAVQAANIMKALSLVEKMVFREKRNFLLPMQLCRLHKKAAAFELESAGCFRTVQVRIGSCSYLPPSPKDIGKIILGTCQKLEKIQNPVNRAFSAFAWLSKIQPFDNCNKRTSWLAACGILLGNGYPPPMFPEESAKEFSRAMICFYEQNDKTILEKYLQKCVDFSISGIKRGGIIERWKRFFKKI